MRVWAYSPNSTFTTLPGVVDCASTCSFTRVSLNHVRFFMAVLCFVTPSIMAAVLSERRPFMRVT